VKHLLNKKYFRLLKEIEEPKIEYKIQENRQLIKYNKPFSSIKF